MKSYKDKFPIGTIWYWCPKRDGIEEPAWRLVSHNPGGSANFEQWEVFGNKWSGRKIKYDVDDSLFDTPNDCFIRVEYPKSDNFISLYEKLSSR